MKTQKEGTAPSGRHQNRDFMEAVAAVCALMASADADAQACEQSSIAAAMSSDPAFVELDADTVMGLMNDYTAQLQEKGAVGKSKISEKVMRFYGNERHSRNLMRLAHRIMMADHQVQESENEEFRRICRILGLDPEFAAQASGAGLAQARDLGV